MDAGLPVIGWRSGNLPHLIDDGEQGIVVTPGDIPALRRALRSLAEDEPTRRSMAAAAARRAAALPTWDQSAERFFRILAGTR
jgi:glycosyltransferase involved in cell wall biosynthesis